MSETQAPQPLAEPAPDTSRRRLAPQVSFKPDPTYDNGKSRAAPADASTQQSSRRTVIRFTREVLIAKRKHHSILPSMAALTDILSDSAQDPVCFETLEPEDVIRIWNSSKGHHEGNRGRGRSRVRGGDDDEGDNKNGDTKDLWDADDSEAFDGKPFDFSKVAEESEKFRSELDSLKKGNHPTNEDPHKMEEIDMDSLIDSASSENAKVGVANESKPAQNLAKVEFGSLLSSTNTFPSGTSSKSSTFDSSFATATVPSTAPSSGSSLLSKIGVKLEPDNTTAAFPPAPPRNPEWFYRDPSMQVQGPFAQGSMRQWNREGYFTADLPIQLRGWTGFYPFVEVFPDMASAFISVPNEPRSQSSATVAQPTSSGSTVASTPAAATTQSAPVASSDNLKKSQSAGRADAQEGAKTTEGSTAGNKSTVDSEKNANSMKRALNSNNSSNAASTSEPKAVSTGGAVESKKANPARNERAEKKDHKHDIKPTTTPVADVIPAVESKSSKGWNVDGNDGAKSKAPSTNLLDIQNEQRLQPPAVAAANAAPVSSAPSSLPTPSASLQLKSFLGIHKTNAAAAISGGSGAKSWSIPEASSSASGSNGSSLQQIMNEELQNKKTVETSVDHRTQAHSWAAKAKTNGVVPSAPTVRAAALPPAPTVAVPLTSANNAPAKVGGTAGARSNQSNKTDFGGKAMAPDMAEWCAVQLRRINGSSDLTLLEYCMSLSTAVEIRETLSANLGSTPQVSNFATEFIRYKEDRKKPMGFSTTDVQQKKRAGK